MSTASTPERATVDEALPGVWPTTTTTGQVSGAAKMKDLRGTPTSGTIPR
jgi:hypothetical protein